MPVVTDTDVICSLEDSYYFKKDLKGLDAPKICEHCLPTCEKTSFDTKVDVFVSDPGLVCRDPRKFKNIVKEKELTNFKNELSIELKYLQGRNVQNKFCEYRVENDLVIVQLEVLTSSIVSSKMRKVATIFDQLSLAGRC